MTNFTHTIDFDPQILNAGPRALMGEIGEVHAQFSMTPVMDGWEQEVHNVKLVDRSGNDVKLRSELTDDDKKEITKFIEAKFAVFAATGIKAI